jgi:hypothetical protein
MPQKSKDERKEYNRQQYIKNKYNEKHNKAREEYILNFYLTMKTDHDFMMWVRNMRRVNKKVFSQEATQKESEIKEETEIDALTDCIRSFLKVGGKYVSLHPSPINSRGVPIFFHIKQIEDEKIFIDYVNIRFVKCGTGEALFIPEWENILGETVIYNKDLFNLRAFNDRESYKYYSYIEIRNSVILMTSKNS